MAASNVFGAPIPVSEIESVLAWVDTFKLSRQTKKINRDFSDAVLLAEILAVHYPKLVEMHNYPPRNSHALKLNNWMTLNRKVLKKLKLNLCVNTMEQLANCSAGVIERVLVMVRDKIKRDEDLERSCKEAENNMSSGGSYYEACGDEDHVLVVPVKKRVNGVLETLQQKVVSYDAFTALKEELKDANDSVELLKQKVDHLDSLIKLKDERINELQKQLDRKQARRKEAEVLQNSLSVPFDDVPTPVIQNGSVPAANKSLSIIKAPSKTQVPLQEVFPEPKEQIIIPEPKVSYTKIVAPLALEKSKHDLVEIKSEPKVAISVPPPKIEPNIPEVTSKDKIIIQELDIERIKSDVFKEAINANIVFEDKGGEGDDLEFKDSEAGTIVTIEDTIDKELSDIGKLDVKISKSGELKAINSKTSKEMQSV